ncbi:MAG: Rrf2 family transcriptional regulator [Candidatus Humimicrobiaceae bacterium]
MIGISTKGRYGTRFMLELALNYGKGLMLLGDIARRQSISEGYLEQIIPRLKTVGLVKSCRGAYGGYALSREPSKITVNEIVTALEGPLDLVDCVSRPQECDRADSCAVRELWSRISEKIIDMLDSESLEDLAEKHKNKQKSQPLMYHI